MTETRPSAAPDAAEIKTCCAVGYSSDVVATLLGDSYHPGGLTLTRQLLDALAVTPGHRLLDVAAGIGTTSLLVAREYAVDVDGVDLSPANIERAEAAATGHDLAGQVRFQVGDAEALPVADGGHDRVVCECALCTFPDKRAAAREFARILRPGGRLGLTDVTAYTDRLPTELATLGAWVACIADARPAEEYAQLLTDAGLQVLVTERHDAALRRMFDQIEARLELLRMTSRARLEDLGVDVDRIPPVMTAARQAVADGILGYVLITAEKPCD